VAAPEDVENALAILTPVLAETVSRIDKRMAEALDAIDEDTPIDKNKLAEKIGISSATAYRVLKALSKHGYLAEHQKQKPYTYTLIKKPSKHIEITSEMGNYRRFWEINLKSWLDGVVSTFHPGICKPKILEPKITFKQASEPDKSLKLRLKSNSGLAENEASSTAVKCETMPTEAFSSSIKEEKSGNTVSGGIAMRDEFLFRYIKPGKPCELCGRHAVEVEIKTPYGAFTRCMECWQKLREQFKNVHWIEEREEA
jgi:predicted transcriptional regulator